MYAKVFRYGNTVEVFEYEKTPKNYGIKKTKESSPKPRRIRKNYTRRADNIRRSKKSFIRLVRANLDTEKPPIFLTLTMYEIIPVRQSITIVAEFFRDLRKRFGGSVRGIAVVEFQKRGAVHFHALVWDLPHEIVEQEKKARILQHTWLRGFCDCINTDGKPALAFYMAKYMQKALQDTRLGYSKGYFSFGSILRPMCAKGHAVAENITLLTGDNEPLLKHEFDTQWLGKATFKVYTIK